MTEQCPLPPAPFANGAVRKRFKQSFLATAFQLALIVVLVFVFLLGFSIISPYFMRQRIQMDTRHRFREGEITRQEAVELLGDDDPVFQEIPANPER
jgi:hypothetical protein